MFDRVALVIQVGYPAVAGDRVRSPVTITRSHEEGPGVGFAAILERQEGAWRVTGILPQMAVDGRCRQASQVGFEGLLELG